MRIIGGKFKGLRLASVGRGDAAAHLRPTSDRVRENIFNILLGGAYEDPVSGANVLDMFAGTGAMGLEALSRGAGRVTFMDNGGPALDLIRRNIGLCAVRPCCDVVRRDATRPHRTGGGPFDLIFLDPPYGKAMGARALEVARDADILAPGAIIVLEEGAVQPVMPGFGSLDQRKYGGTIVHILRFGSQARVVPTTGGHTV